MESKLEIWRSPVKTVYYSTLEAIYLFTRYYKSVAKIVLLVSILAISVLRLTSIEKQLLWCAKWVGLGILSSIGLGTGMHTFVLYLGPHIAAVTMAAYTCGSLNFLDPPYPNEIICPSQIGQQEIINVWTILNKVKLECFMWGAGTAIGELPPYFIAKFRSSQSNSNINLNSGGDIVEQGSKLKIMIENVVTKAGFLGILVCASIPNPLFDLAGITCGTYQIPFLTFFGATLIGKAINKMLIQTIVVIIAFNNNNVDYIVNLSSMIPKIGQYIHQPLRELFMKQRANLHREASHAPRETSWLAWAFEKFVIAIIVFYVVSIINTMAQNYSDRMKAKQERRNQ